MRLPAPSLSLRPPAAAAPVPLPPPLAVLDRRFARSEAEIGARRGGE
jgi:hypothetical protein